MIRRLILLIFVFYPVVLYMHMLLTGFAVAYSFPGLVCTCGALAFALTVINPLIDFLTVKSNIFTKSIIAFLLCLGVIYVLAKYVFVLTIKNGDISLGFLSAISKSLVVSIPLGQTEVILITSLLFAIWGIIMNILI